MNARRLGEMLCDKQLVDDESLRTALEVQRGTGERLGSTLLRLGLVDSASLARILGEQLEVEAVDPSSEFPEADALALMSFTDAMRLGCLPLRVREGELTIAMTEPHDEGSCAQIAALTGTRVHAVVAPQMALFEALKRVYRGASIEDEKVTRIRRVAIGLRALADELEGLLG